MLENNNSALKRRWMRLAEALKYLMTITSLPEDAAKDVIANAIADLTLGMEIGIDRHIMSNRTARGLRFSAPDFDIPKELSGKDLDFANSRPIRPWYARRGGHVYPSGEWEIAWIELDRRDVEALVSLIRKTATISSVRSRGKGQPARERAERALQAFYGNDIPDAITVPDKRLHQQICEKLKELGLSAVSKDTVLRAARRRK